MAIELTESDYNDPDFDADAKLAVEACADTLGTSFTRADEERVAKAWEEANRIPLKRSWWSWAEFKKHRVAMSGEVPFVDWQTATDERRNLLSRPYLTRQQAAYLASLDELLRTSETEREAEKALYSSGYEPGYEPLTGPTSVVVDGEKVEIKDWKGENAKHAVLLRKVVPDPVPA